MTIQRLRNVAIATFVLIATVFLLVWQQDKLPEAYQLRRPFGKPWHNGNNSTIPEQILPEATIPDGSSIVEEPPKPESDQTSGFPSDGFTPEEPSSQEISAPESAPPLVDPAALDNAPELPPSDEPQLPSDPSDDPPPFEAVFNFQQDLDLDLPVAKFQEFSIRRPHNYDSNGPKTNAYATFMATRNPSLKDPYYMAIHSLIYRVLWSPRSRTNKYPFIVFVGDFVTPEQRQLLVGAGAIVRELGPLEWNPNVEGVQDRWKDLFAKLNMWNETEFERILFLDADAFPVDNIDSMFDIAPVQNCIDSKLQPDDYLADGTQVCEPYIFAGVPQDPFNETDVNINVGSMVFTPSERMHQRLLQNYVKTDRYNCLMAEQAFLNWQFNPNSAFPATQLQREWGGFFPSEEDEGKLKVVHEKLWSEDREWMKREWLTQWQEMLTFYSGPQFPDQRKKDGSTL